MRVCVLWTEAEHEVQYVIQEALHLVEAHQFVWELYKQMGFQWLLFILVWMYDVWVKQGVLRVKFIEQILRFDARIVGRIHNTVIYNRKLRLFYCLLVIVIV